MTSLSVLLVDPATGSRLASIAEPIANGIAVSRDGGLLAISNANGQVDLWRVIDPRHPVQVGTIPACGKACAFTSVAFSPDGRTLAAGTETGTYLYPITGHQAGQPQQLPNDTGEADALAFSPDGRFLAAGVGSDTIVWDMGTASAPAQLAIIPAATNLPQVDMLAFSSSGRFLVTGYNDGTVNIWDTDLTDLVSRLCRDTGPPISRPEWGQLLPRLPYDPPC